MSNTKISKTTSKVPTDSITKARSKSITKSSSKAATNVSSKIISKTNAKSNKKYDIPDDVDEIDIESLASKDSVSKTNKPNKPKKKSTKKTMSTKSKKIVKDDENENDISKIKKTKSNTNDSKTLIDVNKIIPHKKAGGKKSYILVIVESPGKIKKLESILGPGYVVTSSFGHIMDLHPKKMSVDFDNDFEPEYHIITNSKKNKKFKEKTVIVKELRAKAANASKVIIAADHDREGEMIGWSYKVVLGLNEDNYERITFNSITKDEVKRAMTNPGKLDMLMVDSQKTRRILDRIVGFKISPGLNQVMGMRNLSAGRVQSIVVKLICEKEQEINKFFEGDNASYFKIIGDLFTENPKIDMKCELFTSLNQEEENDVDENEEDNEINEANEHDDDKIKMSKAKIKSFKNAEKIMKNISTSTFKINDVTIRKSKRYPSPPYTTSTAQQDSSTKLGFNVKRTMTALQKLYETGYTTYLRTDSTNLSKDALQQCTDYIKENFGDDYHNLKNYTNKKGNTQEAHEAIRPVDVNKKNIPVGGKIGSDEQKMYQLVWKRTVASQMSPAEVDVHNINIGISKEKDYIFKTSIDDITFPGFLAVIILVYMVKILIMLI